MSSIGFLVSWSLWASLVPMAVDLPAIAPLPPGSQPTAVGHRFRSSRTYDETLDFYQRLFNQTGGVRWHAIINQPGLRARHVESMRRKTKWEGLNIFDVRGEVRITVLPRAVQSAVDPPAMPTKR